MADQQTNKRKREFFGRVFVGVVARALWELLRTVVDFIHRQGD